MAKCRRCGEELPEETGRCPRCGGAEDATTASRGGTKVRLEKDGENRPGSEDLTGRCTACGKAVKAGAGVCPHCGELLTQLELRRSSARPGLKIPNSVLGGGCGLLCVLIVFGVVWLLSALTTPKKAPRTVREAPPVVAPQGTEKPQTPPPAETPAAPRTERAAGSRFIVLGNAYGCLELDDYKALARTAQTNRQAQVQEELNLRVALGKCRILPMGEVGRVEAVSRPDRALALRLGQDKELWWTGLHMLMPESGR